MSGRVGEDLAGGSSVTVPEVTTSIVVERLQVRDGIHVGHGPTQRRTDVAVHREEKAASAGKSAETAMEVADAPGEPPQPD